MSDIKLNLSEVPMDQTDNLYTYSDLSYGTESSSSKSSSRSGQRGGFFFSSNGSTPNDKKALLAAKLKKWDVLDFMICENMIQNYGSQDSDGNTLLHYLAMDAPNSSVVNKILSNKNAKSFVNKQNKNGDTPLIYAVKTGNHDLATALINAGAKKDIQNKEGIYVETETECTGPEKPTATQLFSTEVTDQDMKSALKSVVDVFMRKGKASQHAPEPESEGSIGFMGLQTEQFEDKPKSVLPKAIQESRQAKAPEAPSGENTEDFLSMLVNKYGQNKQAEAPVQQPQQQEGGSVGEVETEKFLNTLIDKYLKKAPAQSGGKASGMMGQRRLVSYEEGRYNGRKRSNELSRLVNAQAGEIHERVVKKLVEIAGLSEEEARDIKALLWKEVINEITQNGQTLSNLQKAIELEKKISGENEERLKKISKKELEQGRKLREESRKKREERIKEQKERKGEKSTGSESSQEVVETPKKKKSSSKKKAASEESSEPISETSMASVPHLDNLSETSFSEDF